MVKVGKWIAKHKYLIILISILLMIPSVIGMAKTRVNYDILSYLPDTLETIKGQDIMVDEYGMGAFSMVVVENMELKDVQKLEDAYSEIDHVKDVLWYDDVATDVLYMTGNDHALEAADPLELAEIKRRWEPYINQLPDYAYLCKDLLNGKM